MICSTIIPTIGRETLGRSVQSVLDQQLYPQLHEVIVVNDSGTSLGEPAWAKAPNVRIIATNHCERSAARNVGAAAARGAYLCFVDDDDYLLPGALGALTSTAARTTCNRVYGGLRCLNDQGDLVRDVYPDVQGNIFAQLIAGESIAIVGSLVDRSAFMAIGGFDPTLSVREDYDLECRLALQGDVACVKGLVACVRVGASGSTTDWANMREATRLIREKILSNPAAFERLKVSQLDAATLRGRIMRVYLATAAAQLKRGYPLVAFERLLRAAYLVGLPFDRSFWKGIGNVSALSAITGAMFTEPIMPMLQYI